MLLEKKYIHNSACSGKADLLVTKVKGIVFRVQDTGMMGIVRYIEYRDSLRLNCFP